jgi:FKBP-type peptidyl-prolyl cis-trans isomerase FklB
MKKMIMMVLGITQVIGICFADEYPILKDEKDKISYSVGYQIGGDFSQQGTDLDPKAFLKGIEDALSETEPQLSPEEIKTTLLEMKRKIMAEQKRQKQATHEQYRGEGREFLAQNARKEGVVVLPSSLQYKVLRKGTGRTPGPDDMVNVHYRGNLIDGREFFNSRRGKETPETFHVGAVIKGISEALQLMQEGGEWKLFIPADLAYGERGPVAERVVIINLELISVESEDHADSPR